VIVATIDAIDTDRHASAAVGQNVPSAEGDGPELISHPCGQFAVGTSAPPIAYRVPTTHIREVLLRRIVQELIDLKSRQFRVFNLAVFRNLLRMI